MKNELRQAMKSVKTAIRFFQDELGNIKFQDVEKENEAKRAFREAFIEAVDELQTLQYVYGRFLEATRQEKEFHNMMTKTLVDIQNNIIPKLTSVTPVDMKMRYRTIKRVCSCGGRTASEFFCGMLLAGENVNSTIVCVSCGISDRYSFKIESEFIKSLKEVELK